MKIEKIKIKRFRSINDLNILVDSEHNFITICGQNNVGKTNILRAVNLFFDKVNFSFQEDVPEFKQMTLGASIYPLIEITFKDKTDSYTIRKQYDIRKAKKDEVILKNTYILSGNKNNDVLPVEECLQFLNKIHFFYLPSINVSFPELINFLIDEEFLDIEFGKARMRGDKAKLKSNLESVKKGLQNILDDLSEVINPNFREFKENWGIKFNVPKDIYKFRELLTNEIEFYLSDDTHTQINSKGSGLQRLGHILITLRIIDKLTIARRNCILMIDEPDIFLHPRLQKKLKSKLNEISSKSQVFITTHSSIFIDAYNMKNIYIVDLKSTKQYSHKQKKFGNVLSTYLMNDNELDYVTLIKDTLGIEDEDNLSLAKTYLLVEGKEDEIYLSELINYFGFSMPKIIPAGGASTYLNYLNYYNSLAAKVGIKPKFKVLFDNDNAGRESYKNVTGKLKSFGNLIVQPYIIHDAYNTTFPEVKNKPNIEIEDFIYPELIIEFSNKILEKVGLNQIDKNEFILKSKNLSHRFNGVLAIIESLKNEKNELDGLKLQIDTLKGGISGQFKIKGNKDLISQIKSLDLNYPNVKLFLKKLTE